MFDIEKCTSFQGKTGPYILYSAVRIKSIIRKAKEYDIKQGDIIISNNYEEEIAFKIIQFSMVIANAYKNKTPHVLCEYVYSLAQIFSSFYQNCSILKEQDNSIASSRLSLSIITLRYFEKILYMLGIKIPDKM
ncbi:MAG: hypothetical protein EOP34_09990 [Rickettsiales bacterium]|nr:MAG: hypothetical protein EOP34_09990 [Rickettsiales bacterium]